MAVWDAPIREDTRAVLEWRLEKEVAGNEVTCVGFTARGATSKDYDGPGNHSYRCYNGQLYGAKRVLTSGNKLKAVPGSIIRMHIDAGNVYLFVNNKPQGPVFRECFTGSLPTGLSAEWLPAAFFYGSDRAITLLRAELIDGGRSDFPVTCRLRPRPINSATLAPFNRDVSSPSSYDWEEGDTCITSTTSSNSLAVVNRAFTNSDLAVFEFVLTREENNNQGTVVGVVFSAPPSSFNYSNVEGCIIRSYTGGLLGLDRHKKTTGTIAKFNNGDRVRMHWHGPSGELEWFVNDRPLGILFHNLQGKTLYPCAGEGDSEMEGWAWAILHVH